MVLYDLKDKDSSIAILKEFYQIWDLLSIKRKGPNDNVIILNWKDEKIKVFKNMINNSFCLGRQTLSVASG